MRKLMLAATMTAMMLVAAAPAYAQTAGPQTGGNATATGGSVTAKNSIVQQAQLFFQVVNNQQQAVEVDQTLTANQRASATVVGTGDATATNVATNVAVDVADQTGGGIENVTASVFQAIAVAK